MVSRSIRLERGDCLDVMATLDADSLDAMVVDPPYGLSAPPDITALLTDWLEGRKHAHNSAGFMNRKWDSLAPGPRYWREAFRVLKPGAHGVVFAGQRTVDLMGVSLRLAGFEVRDLIGWAYFSGFPKSTDVSKSLDALHGAEREVVGKVAVPGAQLQAMSDVDGTAGGSRWTGEVLGGAITDDAKQWAGFGTAIKPAIEPALLIRKPLSESSIARNVLRWGTGAINVDGCRFAPGDPMWVGPNHEHDTRRNARGGDNGLAGESTFRIRERRVEDSAPNVNRFPANLIYTPKASRRERERGCEHLPTTTAAEATHRQPGSAGLNSPRAGIRGATASSADRARGLIGASKPIRNHHPTVKPVALLRWLARLVTPPGGTVLDPFMGSGSCGVAAALEGFDYLGIELDEWDGNDPRARGGATYLQIARARIEHATSGRWVEAPDDSAVEDNQPQPGLF